MRVSEVLKFDIANGVGWGVSIWVTGCSLHCTNCFNSQIWDKNAGNEYTPKIKQKIFDNLALPPIDHFSILGRRANRTLEYCRID